MTTPRNRRFGRGISRARRTGRNVWVNENINEIPVDNTIAAINFLTQAKDFMKFDTTIVSVVVTDLNFSFQKLTQGVVDFRYALMVAPDTMDNDDFQTLFADSVGSPWMYMSGLHGLVPDQGIASFQFAGGPDTVRIKAKRRFRENNSTLWLIHQNVVTVGSTINENLGGMVRTLLHIP